MTLSDAVTLLQWVEGKKELAEAPIVYISLPLPKWCHLWYYLHSVVWHRLLKLIQGVIDYDNCKGIAKEFDMGIPPYR